MAAGSILSGFGGERGCLGEEGLAGGSGCGKAGPPNAERQRPGVPVDVEEVSADFLRDALDDGGEAAQVGAHQEDEQVRRRSRGADQVSRPDLLADHPGELLDEVHGVFDWDVDGEVRPDVQQRQVLSQSSGLAHFKLGHQGERLFVDHDGMRIEILWRHPRHPRVQRG